MSNAKVKQLIDMGISRAVAVAALAHRDDVMDAAEDIFGGKYDHIKDDEEQQEAGSTSQNAIVVNGGGGNSDEEIPDAGDDDDEEEDEDDGESAGSVDDGMSIGSVDEVFDNDPYKDLGLVKGSKETIIEVEQQPRTFTMPDGSKALELTQSEWLKGCPLGAEQAHLFGLYQRFTQPTPCPSCKSLIGRNPENVNDQLLVLFDSVPRYLEHLDKVVARNCAKCSTSVCLACGEAVNNKGKAKAPQAEPPKPIVVDLTDAADESTDDKKEDETPPIKIPQARDSLLHCAELQACIMGSGLAHIERLFDHTKAVVADDSKPSSGTKRGSCEVDPDSDDSSPAVTHATKVKRPSAAGTGYAGNPNEASDWIATSQRKQRQADEKLCAELFELRAYLPTLSREPSPVNSDYLPDPSTIASLRRRFLPIASSMLSSDSLSDMCERYVVFEELLCWFRTVSESEALSAILAQPIMLAKKIEFITQKKRAGREKHVTFECCAGPRELAQSICNQCQVFIDTLKRSSDYVEKERKDREEAGRKLLAQHLQHVPAKKIELEKPEELDPASLRLVKFCSDFLQQVATIDKGLIRTKGKAYVDNLLGRVCAKPDSQAAEGSQRVTRAAGKRAPVKKQVSAAEREREYAAWSKTVAYDDVDMRKPTTETGTDVAWKAPSWRHALNEEITKTSAIDNPKRGLLIAKELSSLCASLPPGIFVRVDESRLDVLKACIVGPDDTPYAKGLYMFDIFLGSAFNQVPPKVKGITTDGGKARMGPNLYANGHTCLSLLGTWSGPGWIAGKSTLLQVLLSIQSLILGNAEPCTNEPGWERYSGTPQARHYTLNTRRLCTRVAILQNIKDPPALWEDVVRGHFRLIADQCIEMLDVWLREDDGRPTYPDGTSVMHGGVQGATPAAGAQTQFVKEAAEAKKLLEAMQ